MRLTPGNLSRAVGILAVITGIVLLSIGPFVGPSISPDTVLTVEPVSYSGAITLIVGLAITTTVWFKASRSGKANDADTSSWSRVTHDYFDTFSHDMGRPFRRILGKQREVRARLKESGVEYSPAVAELLEEIEQQAPSFRLMLANVRVLVELEDPEARPIMEPIDPNAIVRNIVDRYFGVAAEKGAELSWWSEPQEFGLVYGDSAALDHIVTNLVDNAVKFACGHVEVRLTRNPTHYYIRVWDDGAGIPAAYLPHLFDRGWTPELASRREKTSSGLGLYIARTLARRSGGEIAVESSAATNGRAGDDMGQYTTVTVMLPLKDRVAPADVTPNRS
jgi:signal transduction histidine kinase